MSDPKKHQSSKETIVSKNEKFDNTKYWIEFGIDIEKRRVMLDEEVDEYTVGWIIRAIRRMVDADKTSPIDIYINSYGGSIYDGLALYDVLRACSYTNIRTHALGKIMSMGFIIYLAGDERYSSPRATFMNHQGADEPGYGKLHELDVNVKELKRLEEVCFEILHERTKKTSNWWKKEIEFKDKYYNKSQALKLGIVTEEEYEVE